MIINDLKNIILDDLLGNSATKLSMNLELGLSSTTPHPDGEGGITEPSGNGYARLILVNNNTTFPPAVDGVKVNGIDFVWEPDGGDWNGLGFWVIFDSADGRPKLTGYLDDGEGNPVIVNATDGDTFVIGVGLMRIQ